MFITLEKKCNMCKQVSQLEVRESQLKHYEVGLHVQHAFPHLSAGERELLISGICGMCFDKLFGEED